MIEYDKANVEEINTAVFSALRCMVAFEACDVEELEAKACAAAEEWEAEARSAGMTRICRFGIGVASDGSGS